MGINSLYQAGMKFSSLHYICKKIIVRKNKTQPVYRNITIEDIGSEGKSLARIDDLVVFTTFAIPGDVVDLQVVRKKKRYLEAKVVHFHHLSDLRAEPFCHHFGVCGGCKWQNMGDRKSVV